MRTTGRGVRVRRAVRPWLVGWLAVRVAVGFTGWAVSRRVDIGDESTATIRRTRTAGALRLRPRHPDLSRVRIDLVMAGGELDLTGIPRVPGGVDVTVHLVLAGLAIRVPPGWRVWWSSSGPGGVGLSSDAPAERTDDERGADLRIHATVWFAGVGVQGAAG
jgi:hypothetical protein